MSKNKPALVLVRGGGDLATGVVLRLHRAGMKVVIIDLLTLLYLEEVLTISMNGTG